MAPHYDDGSHYDDPLVFYDVSDPPPITMADKPVTYPVTEVLGFCDATIAMLNNRKTAMIALGVDPTAVITAIGATRDTLNTQNTTQEAMKTALRNQTIAVDAAKAIAYAKASNACDKVIDAFGGTSEQAKEARNLRKGLHHQSRTPATPTPTPSGFADPSGAARTFFRPRAGHPSARQIPSGDR